MTEFPRKIPPSVWLAEAAILVLALIALRKGNPYSFYVFLRWVACPALVWIGWKSYSKSASTVLVVSAGALAVLFNPVIRVMLDREKWEILNIAMIAVAIWSAIVSVKPQSRNP